jgi:Coenzyme A transferase
VAEIVSLAEAIAEAVHDGDTVAMEGFTHLIPHAAGREVIRQERRELTLVRMTPDVIYDQMIGAGDPAPVRRRADHPARPAGYSVCPRGDDPPSTPRRGASSARSVSHRRSSQ